MCKRSVFVGFSNSNVFFFLKGQTVGSSKYGSECHINGRTNFFSSLSFVVDLSGNVNTELVEI